MTKNMTKIFIYMHSSSIAMSLSKKLKEEWT